MDLARRSGTEGEREDGPWRSHSARYAERLCRGTVSAFLKAGAGSWTSTVNIVAHIIEWAKAKAHWVRAAWPDVRLGLRSVNTEEVPTADSSRAAPFVLRLALALVSTLQRSHRCAGRGLQARH